MYSSRKEKWNKFPLSITVANKFYSITVIGDKERNVSSAYNRCLCNQKLSNHFRKNNYYSVTSFYFGCTTTMIHRRNKRKRFHDQLFQMQIQVFYLRQKFIGETSNFMKSLVCETERQSVLWNKWNDFVKNISATS